MPLPSALLMLIATPLSQAAPAPTAQQADSALVKLVTDFLAAERAYDQARIAALVTPDYAEVSPLGELDLHDRFLGFYAPDKKQLSPETRVSDTLIRRFGETASIITRLSFDLPGPQGQPARTVSVRVSFLAVRSGGAWKLASAHYTPERPKTP